MHVLLLPLKRIFSAIYRVFLTLKFKLLKMTTLQILTPQNRESVLFNHAGLRVGIMAPLDKETGAPKLCERWITPFLNHGIDVLLIPVGSGEVEGILDNIDGLLMPGGHTNIHPSFYNGQTPDLEVENLDVERDQYAIKLLKAAYDRDVPTLGICRGMQEMIVAFGGELEKLPADEINHAKGYEYYPDQKAMDTLIHDMTVEPNGVLGSVYGPITTKVNSIHAYGLTTGKWHLNDIFRIEALAPDNVIEAVSARNKSFYLGVQAHFELDGPLHRSLFGRFYDHIRTRHHGRQVSRAPSNPLVLEPV